MPRHLARVAALFALAITALVGLGAGIFTGGTAGASGGVQLGGALIKDQLAQNAVTQGTSENWSGYVVSPSGGHVTGVSGTFITPSAGDFLPGLSSTWVGIGGDGTSDLIQAGTAEATFPEIFGPYYAWYELLPDAPIPLTNCVGDVNCTVNPGDQMAVKITQTGPTKWTINQTDVGHWTWTDTNIQYASHNASAEWILESPTLLVAPLELAGVGVVHFGSFASYSVNNGPPKAISTGNPLAFSMNLFGLGVVTEATPSSLAKDGQSFNVCAYAPDCAPPS